MERLKRNWKYISFLLLIIIILFISIEYMDVEAIQARVVSMGIFGPLLYILAKAMTNIVAPLSGTPFYIMSVPLFGLKKAILYSFLGDFIGNVICFYISRIFGRSVVKRFVMKQEMKRIESILVKMGTVKGFFISRIVLLAAPEIVSYAAGFTSLSVWNFSWISTLVWFFAAPPFIAASAAIIDQKFVLLIPLIFASIVLAVFGFKYLKE